MSAYWSKILKENWFIDAQLQPLAGEYDLNFLVVANRPAILKVMHCNAPSAIVDMQCSALQLISDKAPQLPVPNVIPCNNGELYRSVQGPDGEARIVWLQTKCAGITYADFKPQSLALISQVGNIIGSADKALQKFKHPALKRKFKWNLCTADWIDQHLSVFENSSDQRLLRQISEQFIALKPQLTALPQQAIHNDVNDYNLLVQGSLSSTPQISGLIDFGDMCLGPRICNLAICAAYMVLGQAQPERVIEALVAAYHAQYPLSATELELLWPLLRMRLAVSVVNSQMVAAQNPDDQYNLISQQPAWDFLHTNKVNSELLTVRLRVVCGFGASDSAEQVLQWLSAKRGSFAQVLGSDLTDAPLRSLSVENSTEPTNPFALTADEATHLGGPYRPEEGIWLGYYNEPRLVYTDAAFSKGPYKASNRRTVHIGVDAFAPAGLKVYAPLAAEVVLAQYRSSYLDYGAMVILSHHTTAGDVFYTLYGHLDPDSTAQLRTGDKIEAGQAFAALGDTSGNGGWNPHLHFQLALTLKGMGINWPGVADPDELALYNALCPNPAVLLNLADEKTEYIGTQKSQVLEQRQQNFAENLKLSYHEPVMFLRGWRHHLFDESGRPYLDSYNNVPHVGHAHPRIQAVAADQLLRINSNTRYLHPAQIAFADKILSKMPSKLEVCYFVNSGTEANELALRLARAHSGGKDIITPNHGYLGNTTGAIAISAYKFNAPGGVGQADWVHLVDVADDYRGRYQQGDPDRAHKYAAQVDNALLAITARGGKLAGFIAETFPSVGGQIIPPQGYLTEVYQKIRAAGGLCIADEVQTALGRLGDYYFAFEQQQVVPDIVVMGKPIGNGHPIGVLVTTKEIAASFAQGPEYFSTFGGSNLSCRIGKEVLDIVDDEGLMENARVMGHKLRDGLKKLQQKFPVIGDVRGYGLFIGLDLVIDQQSKEPATELASYIVNRLRDHRILMGTEGPDNNILKIRPPLTIEAADVEMILEVMGSLLAEAECLMSFEL